MIRLITGAPGTGKTAFLVNEIVKELKKNAQEGKSWLVRWFYKFFFSATKHKVRPLFVHGIRDLKIPHTPIYCDSPLCDHCRAQELPENALMVDDWYIWKEQGALVVIDEIQRIWRPSNSATQLPPAIAKLETHRWYGLDFIIVSQNPSLFHKNIRQLVGLHIHLVDAWNGRTQYEWPQCKDSVQSTAGAVVRPYTLPSKIFHLYKSADEHTTLKKRVPLSMYAFAGCIALMIGLSVHIYKRFSAKMAPTESVATVDVAPVPTGGAGALATALPVGTVPVPDKPVYPDFKPTVEGVPESAPAYSGLLKVTAAPLLVGCVYSKAKDECSCFTAQATPYPASKDYCMLQIKNKRFNPFIQTVQKELPSPQAPPQNDAKTEHS